MNNNSPWLEFERPTWSSLDKNIQSDIAIVGGGIAGISTLYFLLRNTDRKIILLEKDRIARGATGHNAAFVINYLEKLTQDVIAEFGIEKTRQGFLELDRGWNLFFEILDEIGKRDEFIPLENGILGYTSLKTLYRAIDEEIADERIGRGAWRYLVAQEALLNRELPTAYNKYVSIVSQTEVLSHLDVIDNGYIAAALPYGTYVKKGRMSSAKLCFNVIEYLQKQYSDRFSIFEQTPISEINIDESLVTLMSGKFKIMINDVILCTNGYTNFQIIDNAQKKNVTKLKESITGLIGYMTAYFDDNKKSITEALFDDRKLYDGVPYFYLHRAQSSTKPDKSLVVVGGPERELKHGEIYNSTEVYPEKVQTVYEGFLKNTYGNSPTDFDYQWHGLMGYTANGIRWVGRDLQYSHLLYNLGCNGIGLLASIAGGEKISKIINGKKLKPSFTDPV